MQNFDILTLVFLGLAVFVIVKLRSVLGTRTGEERPPRDLFERRPPNAPEADTAPSNVVPLQNRAEAPPVPAEEALAKIAPEGNPARAGLLEIMAADKSFEPASFIEGAKAAYEMIVLAFANGDKRTLKDLLAEDVYSGFAQAITDREARGEKVETQFVSVDRAEINAAHLRARSAQVTVRFASKLITATRDSVGAVIDGSAEKVIDVNDIWTFSRDVTARDPNWRLIATESA